MRILKFGGTSMGDEHTWRRVFDIISGYEHPFIVVSATARTTRQLLASSEKALQNKDEAMQIAAGIRKRHLQLITGFLDYYSETESAVMQKCEHWIEDKVAELEAHLSQINREQKLDYKRKDAIAAIGEQLSSYLFAQCGTVFGLATKWIDAGQIIQTDSDFGQASPLTGIINNQAKVLQENIQSGEICIMGGFYGRDSKGNITTLGFEGSDYTASLMGAALAAEAIEIWTDVSGIYTCDPRVVPDARPIPELSFQEATELAYFGAKVLHPSTTKPASQQQIPLFVKNIFEPGHPGTCITSKISSNGRAKAITFKKNCVIVTITSANTVMGYKFLADIFQQLKAYHLAVDVVTTTEASVSIAVEHNTLIEKVIQQLENRGLVEVKMNQAVISLIGCRMNEFHSLLNEVMNSIADKSLNLISFSRSKRNLNVVIDQKAVLKSVVAIHKRIFG